MLEKKDKYNLRKKSNTLKPVVIIGKDGLTENIVISINEAIKKNELIKISVLKTYVGISIKELCELICNTIKAHPIFIIGRVFTIYKKNPDINAYEVK